MRSNVGLGLAVVFLSICPLTRGAVPAPVRPAMLRHERKVAHESLVGPSQETFAPAEHPVPNVPVESRVRLEFGGFAAIQVNIGANGNNIVGDAANEPSLAVDPNDPNKIAIGWRQFNTVTNNFRQAGRAYSNDGGESWAFPGVLQPGEFSSDPVLGSDLDGRFFYLALQPNRGPGNWACHLYRSIDGGVTWPQNDYAYGGDKAWMAIDNTTGPGSGFVHLVWTSNESASCCGPNLYTRSTTSGLRFMNPMPVGIDPFLGTITVDRDGAVFIVGGAGAGNRAEVARSSNGANEAQTPLFEHRTSVEMGGFTAFGGVNPEGALGQMWIASDHSNGQYGGNMYLCGSTSRAPSGDPLDVYFSRSTDRGVTWSPSQKLNDDRNTSAWQWFATMSVAPNGRIDIIWNDTRHDSSSRRSRVYYTFSVDGGQRWSSNIPITRDFDHSLGYPRQNKLGDYYHMVSDDEGAHLAFAATFNGEQDVYYMRINRLLIQCIVSEGLRGDDCNRNGVADDCDITLRISRDVNDNMIPDECETDHDGDGIFDGRDLDIDNDGVDNNDDICDLSQVGAPAQPDGRTVGDADRNCAIDSLDFILLRACLASGGPGASSVLRLCDPNFDYRGDVDVDLEDFGQFQNLYTGASPD